MSPEPTAPIVTLRQHVGYKLTSVRVLATVVALGMWVYMGTTAQIAPEFSVSLISLIISWYFKDREGDQ